MEVITLHLIHYGSDKFDLAKFEPIANRNFVKPSGGLWACPVDTERGWRDWCLAEDYAVESLESSFTFWYTGKILVIDTRFDLRKMIWREPYTGSEYPDFEEMLRQGVDAILLTGNGECETRMLWERSMYGWDCESILIMNPDGIREEVQDGNTRG